MNVDAAAVLVLDPAVAGELPVTGADGVGVDAEAAGKFARAGEPLAGLEVAGQDGQLHLSGELAIDWDFACRREPEPQRQTPRLAKNNQDKDILDPLPCE